MATRKPTVALVNDTSITSPHFGCQLVGQTFREQFQRVGIEQVLGLPKRFDTETFRPIFDQVDLIVINGEGTLHHNKYRHLLDLADQYPTIMVNCVYEANDPNPGLQKLLYCSARESYSATAIQSEGVTCDTIPDVIFNATFPKLFPRTKATTPLGITDNVVKEYHGIWPLRWRVGGFSAMHMTPGQYIAKLCSYERLAIGRFHAAVLASILNIPFSTWDSNTWKLRALMEDMGVPQLHFDSRKEAIANVPEQLPECVGHFVSEARIKIEGLFDKIKEIADDQACRH